MFNILIDEEKLLFCVFQTNIRRQTTGRQTILDQTVALIP